MSGSMLKVETGDGAFSGYLARPGITGTGPAVIVIQEIFGVNTFLRAMCDEWARRGYVAFCPDLFWRIEPGIVLTDNTEEEWGRAFELFQAFDVDKGIEDIAASLDALRTHDAVTGKVGAVGYCLGGKLAYLTAARTGIDASVGYYGVSIPDHLGEANNITSPLMLHIAGKDSYVDAAAQRAMHEGLDDHPRVTLHDYPDDDHAFARLGGEHYNEDSARLANQRTEEFFAEHLS